MPSAAHFTIPLEDCILINLHDVQWTSMANIFISIFSRSHATSMRPNYDQVTVGGR